MQHCLFCDCTLLRHIAHAKVYWYCSHCRQYMPDSLIKKSHLSSIPLSTLPAAKTVVENR